MKKMLEIDYLSKKCRIVRIVCLASLIYVYAVLYSRIYVGEVVGGEGAQEVGRGLRA